MQPAGRFSGKTKMQECRNANVRGGAGASQSRKAELRENAGLQNCGTAKLREAVKAQERCTRSVKTEMEVSDESGMVAEGALQGL